jgi:hypothetical protein
MAYTTDKNGNYKRTVRCGYCYEVGHNKGSCESKKQNHKDHIAAYEKEIADDNFTDDWERNYAQRNLDRHKAELNKTVNRGKNRKCSYCKNEGHTRRTCSFRKGDMNSWVDKCLIAREKFVENMTATGFGLGSLAYRKDLYGSGARQLLMIERIVWDMITHEVAVGRGNHYADVCYGRSFESDNHYPAGRLYQLQLPCSVSNINNEEFPHRFEARCPEVASPAPPSIPEDFLTKESAMKAAKFSKEFDDSRPYEYHGIEYND